MYGLGFIRKHAYVFVCVLPFLLRNYLQIIKVAGSGLE